MDNKAVTTKDRQDYLEVSEDLSVLLDRLSGLENTGDRVMVGIAGAPGAGKSTIALRLAAALGSDKAVVVPMDGFHLPSAVLSKPDQLQRRGAMDTFDVQGYLHMLQRLRARREAITYAPGFEREIEEPVAGLVVVPSEIPIIITEGNYLLSSEPGWREIRPLLDESWFVEIDAAERVRRLTARHVQYGKAHFTARTMAEGSDEANARLIALTRSAADLIVRLI
jgi:pantothenate kinase